jgi:hypothetical protein
VSRYLLSVSVNLRSGVVPQRTRLEMELDRAVDGVSLDAVAGVAEGYVGCGGHGIAAEHAPAMASTGTVSVACSPAASSNHSRGLRLVPSVHALAPPSSSERLIRPNYSCTSMGRYTELS